MRPGFSFPNLSTHSVRIKSGSAFHILADTEVRKRNKTITGCSRFIEEQNVISANIMRTEKTGEKTRLFFYIYAVAGKSFKNRVLQY